MSMVVACAVYIGSPPPVVGDLWFPLLKWPAEVYSLGLLDLLKILIVVLLIRKGPSPGVLVLGAASVFLLWTARYSAMGAFVPFLVFSLLFFASLRVLSRSGDAAKENWLFEDAGRSASIALAIVFLGAALQKLNGSYLAGNEFVDRLGFLGPIIEYTGQVPSPFVAKFLAFSSIAIELGIGIGALLWPRLAAHGAVLFILVLSLIHPSVLFVYFTLCPLLLLIDPDLLQAVKVNRYRNLLSSEFLWISSLLLVGVSLNWMRVLPSVFFLRSGALSLTLLIFHGWMVWKSANELRRYGFAFAGWRPALPTAILLLMLGATPVAAWFGAPAPIGFTMFSGRRSSDFERVLPAHQVRIMESGVCRQLNARTLVYSSTDARFSWERESGCVVSGPTASGLSFVLNRLCREYAIPSNSLETRSSTAGDWVGYVCPKD